MTHALLVTGNEARVEHFTSSKKHILDMVKLKRSYYLLFKVILWTGLFIAFVFTSAKPSIVNFSSKKVMTDISKINKERLKTPAVTICAEMVRLAKLFS